MIDTGYMRKVLVNLVSNAIKFTPDSGRIDIFVASVKGKNGEKLFYMNVCDTGHGLVVEDLEKIFDRFYHLRRVPNIRFTGRAVQHRSFPVQADCIFAWRRNLCPQYHRQGASFRMLMPLIPGERVETNGEWVQPDSVYLPILCNRRIPRRKRLSWLWKIIKICVRISAHCLWGIIVCLRQVTGRRLLKSFRNIPST